MGAPWTIEKYMFEYLSLDQIVESQDKSSKEKDILLGVIIENEESRVSKENHVSHVLILSPIDLVIKTTTEETQRKKVLRKILGVDLAAVAAEPQLLLGEMMVGAKNNVDVAVQSEKRSSTKSKMSGVIGTSNPITLF